MMWKVVCILAVVCTAASASPHRPGFLRSNDQDLVRFSELVDDLVHLFEKGWHLKIESFDEVKRKILIRSNLQLLSEVVKVSTSPSFSSRQKSQKQSPKSQRKSLKSRPDDFSESSSAHDSPPSLNSSRTERLQQLVRLMNFSFQTFSLFTPNSLFCLNIDSIRLELSARREKKVVYNSI